MKNLFLFFFLSLLMLSCKNEQVFSIEKKPEGGHWLHSDILTGTFEITDSSGPYDILFEIEHKENYAYQNIYLKISDDYSGKMSSDTVNIDLMDQYGVWFGSGFSGSKIYRIPLRKNLRFYKNKSYNFNIQQFTRNDTLQGIERIKLYVLRKK